MIQYLIDHTREYLVQAADHAHQKEQGDLRIQILAQPDHVLVRACAGGVHKTWLHDTFDWDKLATEAENPLPGLIDGILFRLERQGCIARPAESGQESGHVGGQ